MSCAERCDAATSSPASGAANWPCCWSAPVPSPEPSIASSGPSPKAAPAPMCASGSPPTSRSRWPPLTSCSTPPAAAPNRSWLPDVVLEIPENRLQGSGPGGGGVLHIDGYVAIAGLIVGFTVGLSGMGGGALMTPILVLLFKVQPLAAVSSDLVASFIMNPVGGAVHLRHGTVNRALAGWLVAGSVPAAFLGVVLLRQLGDGAEIQNHIKTSLGVALLLAGLTMIGRSVLNLRRRSAAARRPAAGRAPFVIRPVPTMLVGVAGGLVVGMTSVGSGSLIIVMLLVLYPQLRANELVGTDLVQAVPLVGSAALPAGGQQRRQEPLDGVEAGTVPGVHLVDGGAGDELGELPLAPRRHDPVLPGQDDGGRHVDGGDPRTGREVGDRHGGRQGRVEPAAAEFPPGPLPGGIVEMADEQRGGGVEAEAEQRRHRAQEGARGEGGHHHQALVGRQPEI